MLAGLVFATFVAFVGFELVLARVAYRSGQSDMDRELDEKL